MFLVVLQHRRSSNNSRAVSVRTVEGGHKISFLTAHVSIPEPPPSAITTTCNPTHAHTNRFLSSSHVVPSLVRSNSFVSCC